MKKIIALSFIFSVVTSCNTFAQQGFSYITYDGKGEVWVREILEDVKLKDDESVSVDTGLCEYANVIFSNLFSCENAYFIPENIKILNIYDMKGHLILDVSLDINKYGGTYYEKRLATQIIRNALDIDGINKVTLLIDGKLQALNEGTTIEEETFWRELTEI